MWAPHIPGLARPHPFGSVLRPRFAIAAPPGVAPGGPPNPVSLARRAVAFVAATGLLLGADVVAASPRAGDPRGASLVAETPGYVGDPNANVVAITFDDGPHPVFTPQILDILRAKGARATFFLIGREAERHPDLVRRIVAEGHVIANHTWDHPHLQGMAEDRFSFQIDHTNQVLESISGQDVVCTRPPYGDAQPDTVGRLAAHGLASVVWSADSEDFEKPGVEAIVANSLAGLRQGSIILMHDGGGIRDQTIAALPRLIDEVRGRGFELVPVCDGRPHKPDGHVDVAGSDVPESIHLRGWAKEPDTADPVTVGILLDGVPALEVVANTARPDGLGGFDVQLPVAPGTHSVCVVAKNVGLGTNRLLGCNDVTVLEAPWYDRLGRYLGLLEGSERFADGSPTPRATDPLHEMVDALVPEDR